VRVSNCRQSRNLIPLIIAGTVALCLLVLFRFLVWARISPAFAGCCHKMHLALCSPYSCAGHCFAAMRGRWARLRGRAPSGPIMLPARNARGVTVAGSVSTDPRSSFKSADMSGSGARGMPGCVVPSDMVSRKLKEAEVAALAAAVTRWGALPTVPALPFTPIEPVAPYPAITTTACLFPGTSRASNPAAPLSSITLPPPPSLPPPGMLSPDSVLSGLPAYSDPIVLAPFEHGHVGPVSQTRSARPAALNGDAFTPRITLPTTRDRPPAQASRTRASLPRGWHEPALVANRDEDKL
jgi:hypothetical protein